MILENRNKHKKRNSKVVGERHFKGRSCRHKKEHLYSAKFFLQGIFKQCAFHLTAAIKEKFSGREIQMNGNVSLGQ